MTSLLTLGGSTDVQNIGFSFVLHCPEHTYTVIASFGSRSSDTSIVNQTSYAGLRFDKAYTASDLTLTAAAIFSGDADLNGIVNTADFVYAGAALQPRSGRIT